MAEYRAPRPAPPPPPAPRTVSEQYVWVRGLTWPHPVQHRMLLGPPYEDGTPCGQNVRTTHNWTVALPANLSENVKHCRRCFP